MVMQFTLSGGVQRSCPLFSHTTERHGRSETRLLTGCRNDTCCKMLPERVQSMLGSAAFCVLCWKSADEVETWLHLALCAVDCFTNHFPFCSPQAGNRLA